MAEARAKKTRRKIDRPRAPGAPFTVDQASAELSLAPRTVRQRIVEGKLRAYRDGRVVRITEADLREYQAERLHPAAAPGPALTIRRHLKPRKRH
jgi:excisionase family DNA binding protein